MSFHLFKVWFCLCLLAYMCTRNMLPPCSWFSHFKKVDSKTQSTKSTNTRLKCLRLWWSSLNCRIAFSYLWKHLSLHRHRQTTKTGSFSSDKDCQCLYVLMQLLFGFQKINFKIIQTKDQISTKKTNVYRITIQLRKEKRRLADCVVV